MDVCESACVVYMVCVWVCECCGCVSVHVNGVYNMCGCVNVSKHVNVVCGSVSM